MAQIHVLVIHKLYDSNKKLVGYTIQDPNGKMMNVTRDALINGVKSGNVKVENMTLTSDGRLLGRSTKAMDIGIPANLQPRQIQINTKAPKKTQASVQAPVQAHVQAPVKKSAPAKTQTVTKRGTEKLLDIYTNGKTIVAGLAEVDGKKRVIFGDDVETGISRGVYSNIIINDGKIDYSESGIKKKSFNSVSKKMQEIIDKSGYKAEFFVDKVEGSKNEYTVASNNDNSVNKNTLIVIASALYNSMISNKIKVDGTTVGSIIEMRISCLTGINDARKAVKQVGKVIKR